MVVRPAEMICFGDEQSFSKVQWQIGPVSFNANMNSNSTGCPRAAATKKDFPGSLTHVIALADNATRLTPEQTTNDGPAPLGSDLGTQAFQAASAGDKAAAEVVKQMKASPFGNPDGR